MENNNIAVKAIIKNEHQICNNQSNSYSETIQSHTGNTLHFRSFLSWVYSYDSSAYCITIARSIGSINSSHALIALFQVENKEFAITLVMIITRIDLNSDQILILH